MFTGIVQGLGTLKSIEEGDGITTFCVANVQILKTLPLVQVWQLTVFV